MKKALIDNKTALLLIISFNNALIILKYLKIMSMFMIKFVSNLFTRKSYKTSQIVHT